MFFLVDPPRSSNLPPGYDEEDPYVGDNLEEYPDWWRENIELFREYGLRPYRPSQFTDGEPVPETVDKIEEKYDVIVQLCSLNVQPGDKWEIRVEGEIITTVDRYRDGDGYSVYEITSDAFKKIVSEHLQQD